MKSSHIIRAFVLLVLITVALSLLTLSSSFAQPAVGLDMCWTPSTGRYEHCILNDSSDHSSDSAGGRLAALIRKALNDLFAGLQPPPPRQPVQQSAAPAARENLQSRVQLQRRYRSRRRFDLRQSAAINARSTVGGEYVRVLRKLDREQRHTLRDKELDWIDVLAIHAATIPALPPRTRNGSHSFAVNPICGAAGI